MTKKGCTQVKSKLIYGFGVNDAPYPVHETEKIGGVFRVVWICPYYVKWTGIIERVFSEKYHKSKPSYVGCTIEPAWKYFTEFVRWVDSQPNKDWQNCEPDKDFLSEQGKHYGPNTVVFLPNNVNSFIADRKRGRGQHMLGVHFQQRSGKFVAQCCDPFKQNSRQIGYFDNELEAHKAWQAKKHEDACQLADLQEDPRVAKALRERYAPDKDWTKV